MYIGYRTQKIFSISVTVPKFWWETKGTPDGEKLVSSVTHVRRRWKNLTGIS